MLIYSESKVLQYCKLFCISSISVFVHKDEFMGVLIDGVLFKKKKKKKKKKTVLPTVYFVFDYCSTKASSSTTEDLLDLGSSLIVS